MQLRDFDFKPTYRTDVDDIAADFLVPGLARASQYDRAAGYFSSSSFRPLSRGLGAFISHGGEMRLIMSPELSEEDIESIAAGYAERDMVVEQRLSTTIDELEADTEAYPTRVLTWLIARKRLQIRIAIPNDLSSGIFHEKIGVIRDDSYTVAFTGSLNETGAAFQRNFESIDVFCSWKEPARAANKVSAFERLWANSTEKVSVRDFPIALRDRLISIAPRDMPTEPKAPVEDEAPKRPLRAYQLAAIEAWRANDDRGILEMATGTGKTVTAIEAIRQLTMSGIKLVVVLAPLKHLIEQWERELRSSLSIDFITCFSDTSWRANLPLSLQRLQLGNSVTPLLVLATYDTAESVDFQDLMAKSKVPALLVADEMHNITSERGQKLFHDRYTARLGLSATPRRYMDDVGTAKALKWFNGIVFKFGLEEAIEQGFLTPYDYFPIFCSLSESETEAYNEIITELDEIESDTSSSASERRRRAGLLALKRESLLEKAEDKLIKFEQLIRQNSFQEDGYNLVYVHHELLNIVQLFLGREMHFKNHRFTARESVQERREVLDAFAAKAYAFLIAIRCLDEGVDVPSTRTAFILNSSANPKEFVQRRGRILRLWPGKESARIYDFVVLPGQIRSQRDEQLWEREFERFSEFAKLARNQQTALLSLDIKKRELGIGALAYGS